MNREGMRERLARAREGDTSALTLLLAETRAPLVARLQRRIPPALRGTIDADDVVQETHIAVFRNIRHFEPQSEDAFERWVSIIALRKLRDAIRRRRAAKRGGNAFVLNGLPPQEQSSIVELLDLLAANDSTPSRCTRRVESLERLGLAMEVLPPDYRDAVRLVYLEGVPVQDVARRMNRTARAVHNLCRKAKVKLRERLGSASQHFSDGG